MISLGEYIVDKPEVRFGFLEAVPEAEIGDRERLLERLRRDGYLFLRQFLDRDEVMRFRRYYFETLAPSGLTRPGSGPAAGLAGDRIDRDVLRRLLFGEIVPGPTYNQFCTQSRIWEFYVWLFGRTPFLHRRRLIRHTIPGAPTGGGAHYDLVYIRQGTDSVLTSWIPLGDCPAERGGLVYLEGSHLRTQEDEAGGVARPAARMTRDLPALAEEWGLRWLGANYEAGDMVVHSAYMVHSPTDNVDPTGIMRLSTDIRFQPSDRSVDTRWQGFWHDQDGL